MAGRQATTPDLPSRASAPKRISACETSRNTLALIRNWGVEPVVILYLDTPPSRDKLKKLIADMGISVHALLRKNTEPYEKLGLAENRFSDKEPLNHAGPSCPY